MKKNTPKALPLTITLGSLLLVFCLALTTLWNIVIVYNTWQLKEYAGSQMPDIWSQWVILGIGSFLFVVIIVGITLFIIFMSRQIILNQLQKNFIDSMTHELKTPITSLKLYVETLQRHDLKGEQKSEFLNTMLADIEHLNALVNHVIEAAKVDYARQAEDFHPLTLQELLQECMHLIIRRYRLPASVFTFQVPQEQQVLSDPEALKLVLVNLFDNAIKYAGETPHVWVSSELREGVLYLKIKDSGMGIPENEQRKIFSRFYRGSLSSTQKGTGLGLFIVKETLKRLKGKISLESAVGQGTEFTLVLPVPSNKA